eukprot:3731164-Karenia_brevis.AAC.1
MALLKVRPVMESIVEAKCGCHAEPLESVVTSSYKAHATKKPCFTSFEDDFHDEICNNIPL